MAEVTYTQERTGNGDTMIKWSGVGNSDTFQAIELDRSFTEASVQIDGTFASATVSLQGSNDGVSYIGLVDEAGNAINALASAAISSVGVKPLYMKPTATGGLGGQSVDVCLLLRR